MDTQTKKSRGWWAKMRRRPAHIAVLPLTGVISPDRGGFGRQSLNLQAIAPALDQLSKIKRLKAIALAINSPGGSPVQSALIHDRIRAVAQEHKLPVYGFCQDVAASGGYWIACAADEIYVNDSSIVGSIGVISGSFGLDKAIKRIGVERRLYTAGDNKSFMDPFSPEKKEDVERLLALQATLHETFKAHVRRRRQNRLKADETVLMNGDFWTGTRAVELGLVDGIGELRSVLKAKFGDDVEFKTIGQRRSFLQRFGIGSRTVQANEPAAWCDAVMTSIEARAQWARYGL